MLYTSVVMTENAFYPAFMLFVWALVAALERPTPLRQLAVFAALGLAYVFRAQAVALLPAILTAILLLALLNAVAVPTARARAALAHGGRLLGQLGAGARRRRRLGDVREGP